MLILAGHRFTNPDNVDKSNNIGLCNFLKTILSVFEIVSETHTQTKFICPNLSKVFNQLYINDLIYTSSTNNFQNIYIQNNDFISKLKNNSKLILTGWRLYNRNMEDIKSFKSIDLKSFPDNLTNSIDFKYNNIPFQIKEKYIQLLNKLKINQGVLECVNKITNKYEQFLSVHIRTWKTSGSFQDNRSSSSRYNHYFNNRDNFIKFINESKLTNVFISTDNLQEIQYIIDKIENKNIFYYTKNKILSKLQNDFVDLLILSRGTQLIGSHISTFTEMAWWYSNCNKNIIII